MGISDFDLFARIIIYVNGSTSYLMNATLIYFILFHSRKHMGAYRYLMLLFAMFNMIYPGVHIVVMPNMHSHGYGFVLFPTSFLEETQAAAHWGISLYGCCFCQSITLLAFHFVYRYLLICKNNWLFIFNQWRYVPIFVLIWLVMGMIWGTVLHFFMYNTEYDRSYFREVLWETYGLDVNKTAILGPLYTKINEFGEEVWSWEDLFAFAACMSELGGTFAVILFCTYNIRKTLKVAVMSDNARRLQYELFKALIVQTLVPVCCEYFPCAILFIGPLFNLSFGRWDNFVPIAISFYPLLDPMCIIYFIKDYRYAFKRKFGCRGKTTIGFSSSDPGKESSNREDPKIHITNLSELNLSN